VGGGATPSSLSSPPGEKEIKRCALLKFEPCTFEL
jgi:hypothetical protein